MGVGPDIFGEDYLYFYEPVLTDERSEAEAAVAWRVLELEEGAEVLDLACGHGRIANRLAARGALVTGLDTDRVSLERAGRDAAESGVEVTYLEGDMRRLAWHDRFDAALLWFTAFGYFDPANNQAVLEGLCRALRPGGRLVVELNHLPWTLAHFLPQSFVRRGDDFMLDERVWHAETSVMETRRLVIRDGGVRETPYSHRMYMPAELAALLQDAGFREATALGRTGEPLVASDPRLLMLARV